MFPGLVHWAALGYGMAGAEALPMKLNVADVLMAVTGQRWEQVVDVGTLLDDPIHFLSTDTTDNITGTILSATASATGTGSASKAKSAAPVPMHSGFPANTSKWMLWQDPVRPLFEPSYRSHLRALRRHYEALSTRLCESTRSSANSNGHSCLVLPGLLAAVLALKLELPTALRHAQNQWHDSGIGGSG